MILYHQPIGNHQQLLCYKYKQSGVGHIYSPFKKKRTISKEATNGQQEFLFPSNHIRPKFQISWMLHYSFEWTWTHSMDHTCSKEQKRSLIENQWNQPPPWWLLLLTWLAWAPDCELCFGQSWKFSFSSLAWLFVLLYLKFRAFQIWVFVSLLIRSLSLYG